MKQAHHDLSTLHKRLYLEALANMNEEMIQILIVHEPDAISYS
jgi:predicted MPP superfamily phosphohydrolase